jgi:para-aminobenzoate synthetase component 1
MPQTQFMVFDAVRAEKPKLRSRLMDPIRSAYSHDHLLALADSPRVRAMTDQGQYLDAVRQIKKHIRDGDIYQANCTQAFDIVTEREGFEIYEDLAASNPAPFAAYLRFPPLHWDLGSGITLEFPALEIISNSPERFWKKTGPLVETRPIKGTIARGESPRADQENCRQLLQSPKDRAELLMITDLERNDLGKLAKIGSVKVQALRRARACPSIWHLESVVTALVDPEVKWYQLMQSMFPGGSITGAPKRRAMEILRSLETVPRGVYCGAIGWVTANGDADFSIAIRTAVKMGKNVRVHGGGGIVADSDPWAEYHESLIKIAPLLECLCR